MITPGRYVHHKVHVGPATLHDPEVLTNWDNLQTLCRKHHEEMHPEVYRIKRYRVDEFGFVTTIN